MERVQGLLGMVVLLVIAVLLSNNRRRIDWKLVGWGIGLQVVFALLILRTPVGVPFFTVINTAVTRLIDYTGVGTTFLFKPLNAGYVSSVVVVEPDGSEVVAAGETVEGDTVVEPTTPAAGESPVVPVGSRLWLRSADGAIVAPPLVNLAFWILPTIIFFSGLLAVLYHLGVMQWVVKGIAWVMVRTMGTSGAETLCVASNIFVGQTEAPLMVRPFLLTMTRSELMAVMVGGFATIAGGVMALYIGMLQGAFESLRLEIAGHMMAASVMSAPAALVMAKVIYPETETPATLGTLNVAVERTTANVLEAFGEGVTQGLQLALNVAAMLIAFVAAVALINGLLGLIYVADGVEPYSLQWLLGRLFQPLAWTMGAPWNEAQTLGTLMGEKLVLTELIAYSHLCELGPSGLSNRTTVIATYALCGFANFASIGVQLGGIGALAPSRRSELANLVLRAMIGGALASWMTAAIAGMLLK